MVDEIIDHLSNLQGFGALKDPSNTIIHSRAYFRSAQPIMCSLTTPRARWLEKWSFHVVTGCCVATPLSNPPRSFHGFGQFP